MNLSEAIVSILIKEGITNAFGIPGASINALYAALSKQGDKVRHITMRHEECCVHAAGGYFRASGRMALALATSGPGATNFLTGLYTANIDSIPLIAIAGQAVRAQMGKDAFQSIDIVAAAKPLAKYAVCLTDPATAIDDFIYALRLAREGKPGPVLIDLPLDMQSVPVDFDPEAYVSAAPAKPRPSEGDMRRAMEMLSSAKNPLILVGGGAVLAGAEAAILAFAEKMNILIASTYMAKGSIPYDHPLSVGSPGIQSSQRSGMAALLAADVVLAIGNRFTDRHTGGIGVYQGERKFIHINIAPSEIGKIVKPALGIVADAKEAADMMLALAGEGTYPPFAGGRAAVAAALSKGERRTDQDDVPINPHRVFGEINKAFDDETIFVTGCGITQIWSGQLQKIRKARKYLPSGGAGTLGWDIPGAIGAMLGTGMNHKAVCLMGDFGFTFHVQELATAATNEIPIIVVIVNNAYLGLIRQNQVFAFGYEYGVAMPENQSGVDYVQVALGLGCAAECVYRPEDIAPALERAKASKLPYVIDIICEPGDHCSMGNTIDAVKEWNT